jgi:hypothetical protein
MNKTDVNVGVPVCDRGVPRKERTMRSSLGHIGPAISHTVAERSDLLKTKLSELAGKSEHALRLNSFIIGKLWQIGHQKLSCDQNWLPELWVRSEGFR